MINFLFGLFQSSNALRYTFWLLWRLKVDIWLSLSSLQFTDTYQVLYFSCRPLKIKVSFLEEKGKHTRILVRCSERSCLLSKIYCAILWQKWILISLSTRRKGSAASHVALRCFCYYHCSKTIYYSRVPGHCVKERGMNSLLRLPAKGQRRDGQNEQTWPQERIRCIDYAEIRGKEWEALFLACHVTLMGVSFKSQGVANITRFTQKCIENAGWRSGVGCF